MAMRWRSALFFVVLFTPVLARARAQDAQGSQAATDRIHGSVINSVTREPIGRALVFSTDNRFAAMTDSEGHFEFTFPAANSSGQIGTDASGERVGVADLGRPYMLMARKPGFLEDSHTRVSNLGAGQSEITISLTPEALIVGRVQLPSADAPDRIQVQLYQRQVRDGRAHWVNAGNMATSRSKGEFRFAELHAGTYKLITREQLDRDPLAFDPGGQMYGFPPVYFPNASGFEGAAAIPLVAGQTFQANVVVTSHPYYRVKIPVANSPGVGSGINVFVYAQGRGPGYSLGYDPSEQAITGMLPDGTYTVEAVSFGATSATGIANLTVKGAAAEGAPLALVADASMVVNVKEEFTSNDESNSGSVVVSSGLSSGGPRNPRSYLNVYLEPVDDFGDQRGASSGASFGLQIENVQPGRYWLRINSSRGFVSSAKYGDVDLLHEPLVVGSGGTTTPIEITMRDDGANLEGTVAGLARSDANQVRPTEGLERYSESGGHVYLIPLPDSPGELRETWVQPDGKFNVQQIPPGTYHVLAFDHPQQDLEYQNPEAMRAYESKGQIVRLEPGQKEQLRLDLISGSE